MKFGKKGRFAALVAGVMMLGSVLAGCGGGGGGGEKKAESNEILSLIHI